MSSATKTANGWKTCSRGHKYGDRAHAPSAGQGVPNGGLLRSPAKKQPRHKGKPSIRHRRPPPSMSFVQASNGEQYDPLKQQPF